MQNSLAVMPLVTVADQLAEFGVVFESLGITFTRELSDPEFASVANLINTLDSQGRTFFNFMLGDLWNSAAKHEHRAERLQKMFGKRIEQVWKYASIARAFPMSNRDFRLPWWLYEELAAVPVANRDEVMDMYVAGTVTRERVREWKRGYKKMQKAKALGNYPPAEGFDHRLWDGKFSVVMNEGSPNPLTGAPDYVRLILPTWTWPKVQAAIEEHNVPIFHAA